MRGFLFSMIAVQFWLGRSARIRLNVTGMKAKPDKMSDLDLGNTYGFSVTRGANAVVGIAAWSKDPNLATAGNAIASVGAIMPLMGPAGLVAGGVLQAVGGIMSLFGPKKPPQPSNTDVLNAIAEQTAFMRKGFEDINKRLDGMVVVLDDISASLTYIKHQVQDVKDILLDMNTKDYRIFDSIDEVHTAYSDLQEYMKSAARAPERSKDGQMNRFFRQALLWRDRLILPHGVFSQDSGRVAMRPLTAAAAQKRPGKRCLVVRWYMDIIAARSELEWIRMVANMFDEKLERHKCSKDDPDLLCAPYAVVADAKRYEADIKNYKKIFQGLHRDFREWPRATDKQWAQAESGPKFVFKGEWQWRMDEYDRANTYKYNAHRVPQISEVAWKNPLFDRFSHIVQGPIAESGCKSPMKRETPRIKPLGWGLASGGVKLVKTFTPNNKVCQLDGLYRTPSEPNRERRQRYLAWLQSPCEWW